MAAEVNREIISKRFHRKPLEEGDSVEIVWMAGRIANARRRHAFVRISTQLFYNLYIFSGDAL